MVRPLSNDVGSDAENEFLVDAEMWRRLPWSCWSVSRNGYVQCCGVMLHLVVAYLSGVEFKRDTVIDHKNRNRMDNRLENLRPCTAIENGWNNERRHGHQLKNGKWRFTIIWQESPPIFSGWVESLSKILKISSKIPKFSILLM